MEPKRIFDILDYYISHYPGKQDALANKQKGEWTIYSIHDYYDYARHIALGLLALGIKKGDKIASVSENRPEWNFFDMAMLQIGVIHVPIYPTISPEEYEYILKHSEAKYLLLGSAALYKKVKPIADKIKNVKDIYTFDDLEGVNYWQLIYQLGVKHEDDYTKKWQERKDNVKENELATIIYTSGTTGTPKGVMLSHRNMVQNVMPPVEFLPLNHKDKVLSFLPLCHVYERLINYIFQYKGIGIYYGQNMGTIKTDLVEIKANGFNTVPRLLEKVHESIVQKGKNLPFHQRKLYSYAVKFAENFDFDKLKNPWYRQQHRVLDNLIYKQWRAALGGNIKYIGSGGAALDIRLSRFYHAAGFNIQEGYGLTETSPLISFNQATYPNKRFGAVGMALHNEEVKIADDGEILVKGPNVMLGYYKNPEKTKEAIDDEGFFHTGDVGTFIDGKFLKITDRKKEIFKSSAGKYISPQVIENKMKQSFYINQAIVVGENEKFVSALISPNFNELHVWASDNNIDFRDNETLIKNPKTLNFFQKEIDKINKQLGDIEKIKRFKLVCEEWSPETGELSPTLKLRRHFIYRKYAHLLEEIYGHPYQSTLLGNEEAQTPGKEKGNKSPQSKGFKSVFKSRNKE